VEDVSQLVRGLVVDPQGRPVPDAVVEQQGVATRGPNGGATTKASSKWPTAGPPAEMILQVSARGMAPKLFTEPTGADRKTMTVGDGASVRGRLMFSGKPVANAEVGLIRSRLDALSPDGVVDRAQHRQRDDSARNER
jgi:hypothetical protein